MTERLAAYLMGMLGPAECEALERELAADPELAALANEMRRALEDAAKAPPAPRGLAADTCAWIAEHERLTPAHRAVEPAGPVDPAEPASRWRLAPLAELSAAPTSRWRLLDLAVAATLVAGLAIVFLPALAHSRSRSEVTQCRDHLRQLGSALIRFAQRHGDRIPGTDPEVQEPRLQIAGLYGPVLVETGMIDDPRLFLCPSAPLASDAKFRVPTRDELITAEPERYVWLRRYVSGSYAITLGVLQDGRYEPPMWRGRSHFVLLADAPNELVSGRGSSHHGLDGQNVLYEDGHVAFAAFNRPLSPMFDHPFENFLGQVAPGVLPDDAVLVPGWYGLDDWRDSATPLEASTRPSATDLLTPRDTAQGDGWRWD